MSSPLKRPYRAEAKTSLAKLNAERKEGASRSLKDLVLQELQHLKDASFGAYVALEDEVSLDPLIEELRRRGTVLSLPEQKEEGFRFILWEEGADMSPSEWGIPFPQEKTAVEAPQVLLVPGLAFGKNNSRLGRGAGFYDRLVSLLRSSQNTPLIWGVCFQEQLLDVDLQLDEHDQLMDQVFVV